jgi:hypothetical protein
MFLKYVGGSHVSEATDVRPVTAATERSYRLIYRSHSLLPTDSDRVELGHILRSSRANNAHRGVTGALLMYGGWFAQVLEGSQPQVRQLFDRIKVDPRHDAVTIHEEGEVDAPVFARWAMADVSEHGEPDVPLVATATGVVDGGTWKTATPEQEEVLAKLRDLTRGYGRGS